MKIIQLNVEKDKHREGVRSLIEKFDPDVLCLEEVIFDPSLPSFEDRFGASGVFVPVLLDDFGRKQGTAIVSKHGLKDVEIKYYWKDKEELLKDIHREINGEFHYALIKATITCGGVDYKVAVTHFPVSYPGTRVSEFQMTCFENLKPMIDSCDDIIFCADLNSARGLPIYDYFAGILNDNVPKDVTTTIDGALHRAGHIYLVVDSIFTSNHYDVSDISLIDGVSDHLALLANIVKKV